MSFDSFASVVEELLRQYPVLRQPRYQNVFQFCSKLDESVYRNHLSFLRASRESLAAPWLPASTVDGSNVDAVLTLAWLAFFSYADESELREHFAAVGFPELRVWRGLTSCADSVQCVIAQNSRSVVVSFASTQPLHYSDFLASSRVDLITRFDTVGINIGRQRKSYFDSVLHIVDVWQPLQDILRTLDGRRLYFTGHGLGGALATVLAAMLLETPAHRDGLAHCGHLLTALVTFGSPKVGDASFSAAFTSAFGGRALRVANRFEMAIHNPPWPMLSWAPNYEHVGSLAYFDGDSAHPRSFDANGAPTALTLVDRFPFLLADFLPTEIIRRLSRLQAFHARTPRAAPC